MNRRNSIGIVKHNFNVVNDLFRFVLIVEFVEKNLSGQDFAQSDSFIAAGNFRLGLFQKCYSLLLVLKLLDNVRQYLH